MVHLLVKVRPADIDPLSTESGVVWQRDASTASFPSPWALAISEA